MCYCASACVSKNNLATRSEGEEGGVEGVERAAEYVACSPNGCEMETRHFSAVACCGTAPCPPSPWGRTRGRASERASERTNERARESGIMVEDFWRDPQGRTLIEETAESSLFSSSGMPKYTSTCTSPDDSCCCCNSNCLLGQREKKTSTLPRSSSWPTTATASRGLAVPLLQSKAGIDPDEKKKNHSHLVNEQAREKRITSFRTCGKPRLTPLNSVGQLRSGGGSKRWRDGSSLWH